MNITGGIYSVSHEINAKIVVLHTGSHKRRRIECRAHAGASDNAYVRSEPQRYSENSVEMKDDGRFTEVHLRHISCCC